MSEIQIFVPTEVLTFWTSSTAQAVFDHRGHNRPQRRPVSEHLITFLQSSCTKGDVLYWDYTFNSDPAGLCTVSSLKVHTTKNSPPGVGGAFICCLPTCVLCAKCCAYIIIKTGEIKGDDSIAPWRPQQLGLMTHKGWQEDLYGIYLHRCNAP